MQRRPLIALALACASLLPLAAQAQSGMPRTELSAGMYRIEAEVAATGVDLISLGALSHALLSAKARLMRFAKATYLWLVGADFAWRLRGALARPRLAGPGYLVWAIGRLTGADLDVARLGVLAPPRR